MVVHTDDTYSWTGNVCTKFDDWVPQSCESLNTRTDKDEYTPVLIWFIAAFPDTSNPGVTVAYFGIDLNLPAYYIDRHGYCGPGGTIEVPDTGWPDDVNAGNSVAFGSPITGDLLFPFYWFSAYGFTDAYLGTAMNPTGGYAAFVDDGNPPIQDEVTSFGVVRWYSEGSNGCPVTGGGLDGGEIPPDGDEDLPDGGEEEDSAAFDYQPQPNPSNVVEVYFSSDALAFDHNESEAVPIGSIEFAYPEIPRILSELGALTVEKAFPGTDLSDTLGYNINGQAVSLPDISGFYNITFRSSSDAVKAVPRLLNSTSAIHTAEVLTATLPTVAAAYDPYFDTWNFYDHDAQWHLQNDGDREEAVTDPRWREPLAGWDIKAGPAWERADSLGDSRVTIGFVDHGIMGGWADSIEYAHEDLRVVPLTRAQRDTVHSHNDKLWCHKHGTLMAGLAAARTNNALGVAGVCGNCSLLDIKSSSIDCCDTSPASPCSSIAGGIRKVEQATGWDLEPHVLSVVNLSFAQWGYTLSTGDTNVLWRTYLKGIALVAPAGDRFANKPVTVAPANAPCVLGVGGSTWDGLFWDRDVSTLNSNNGTIAGFADIPDSGGRNVDLCAPANGCLVSTSPFSTVCGEDPPDTCFYTYTTGQASGAAAQVSGAIGLMQSIAIQKREHFLHVDDVFGILQATATPFRLDPTSHAVCEDCEREHFGNGILNLDLSTWFVDEGYPEWSDPSQQRIARKSHLGRNVIEWEYAPVDSAVIRDTLWCMYRARAVVQIGTAGPPPQPGFPHFAAWARPCSSNTYPSYFELMTQRRKAMDAGFHHCRMGLIDHQSGLTTLTGYDYAYLAPEVDTLVYEIGEENIEMAYVELRMWPVGIRGSYKREPVSRGVEIISVPSPGHGEVRARYRTKQSGELEARIFDVGGRLVRTIALGEVDAGDHLLVWDCRDDRGRKLASGAYWLRLELGKDQTVKRLMIIR